MIVGLMIGGAIAKVTGRLDDRGINRCSKIRPRMISDTMIGGAIAIMMGKHLVKEIGRDITGESQLIQRMGAWA